MNKEIETRALELFNLVKEKNSPDEVLGWLEEIAESCVSFMDYIEEFEEEELDSDDTALIAVIEPLLFLLGAAISSHYLDNLSGETH